VRKRPLTPGQKLWRARRDARVANVALAQAQNALGVARRENLWLREQIESLRPGRVDEVRDGWDEVWELRYRIIPSTDLFAAVGAKGVIDQAVEHCRRQLYAFARKRGDLP
jgi:hypothetical protein